jgi:Flp pilus assembly pilin Flp
MTPNRRRFIPLADATGQTLTEYSLLIVLIAIVVALAIPAVATGLMGFFTAAAAAFGA